MSMTELGRDYAPAISRLRRMAEAARYMDAAARFITPIASATAIAGMDRASTFTLGLEKACEVRWSMRQAASSMLGLRFVHCPVLRSVWLASEVVCEFLTEVEYYQIRDVFGVPVMGKRAASSDDWFEIAEPLESIYSRMRRQSSYWMIDSDGGAHIDTREPYADLTEQTQGIINRILKFKGCRAVVLQGPPGSGKSVAARQIVHAIAGSCVWLDPRSAGSEAVWACVEVLKPEAVVVDDLDTVDIASAGTLLARLERAHGYARVIVSTANVVAEMRGALMRPGRAADDDVYVYRDLDPKTRQRIAPALGNGQGADLLAAYAVEAQRRHDAGVDVDIGGLRARMLQAGDR